MRAAPREPAHRELRDRAGGARGMTSPQPRIGVLRFPGACDDRDAHWALAALDAEAVFVWHTETELPDLDAVVLPGGFSYGDYLRCGAIARFAPAMEAIADFAARGGLVLGICNGFQILCEAGLLPGVLRRERLAVLHLPRRPADGRARGHAVHHALRRGPAAGDPGEARRGLLVRGRRAVRAARGPRPDRPPLRRARERVEGRRRRRRQRGRATSWA